MRARLAWRKQIQFNRGRGKEEKGEHGGLVRAQKQKTTFTKNEHQLEVTEPSRAETYNRKQQSMVGTIAEQFFGQRDVACRAPPPPPRTGTNRM